MVGSFIVISNANKDASDTVEVIRVKSKNGLQAYELLTEKNIEKYNLIRKEYTEDMILAEEMPDVLNKYSKYYIRKNSILYKDQIADEKPLRNEWLYSLDEDLEVITIPYNYLECGGDILMPGDRIRIRITYEIEDNDTVSVDPFDSNPNLLNKKAPAKKLVTDILFDSIVIKDMLNSNSHSIYELYKEVMRLDEDKRQEIMKSDDFLKSIQPRALLLAGTPEQMTNYAKYQNISAKSMLITILSRAKRFVSLTSAASQIKKYKKSKKEREEKYLQFIADIRSELAIAKEQQIKSMYEMNPDPAECIQRICRIDNKLWERMPSHNDFLLIRIGIGSVSHCIKINYTKQAIIMETDPLMMEPHRLALEFQNINDVPVTLNLVQSGICGIAGEKTRTDCLVRNILIQCITHHGYDDIRIVILASGEEIENWKWLGFIPHVWDDKYTTRYLLCGKAMAHRALSNLYSTIKERELKKAEINALPHYIFIVEDITLLENEPISRYLYNNSSSLGISAIFIAPNKAYLPMNCTKIITIDGKNAEIADRFSGEKAVFIPDLTVHNNLNIAARKMAALRLKNSCDEFSLPESITLLEMYKVKNVTEVDALSLWKRNKTFMGMKVPIGAKAGGEPFYLDIHETGYGPHGLVAGTTGSGKSELLQSIIISLAINFHPHDIVFVLIDYKGGGMADVFEKLPHLVGTITNLGGNQTNRALLSIKSELMRRQRIFSEYGVNNIDKYQKLYYSRKERETTAPSDMTAIPHLIMIADEFAELKQDQPEFMKELISTSILKSFKAKNIDQTSSWWTGPDQEAFVRKFSETHKQIEKLFNDFESFYDRLITNISTSKQEHTSSIARNI